MEEQKENRFSGMTPEEIRLEAKRQIVRSAFLALAALIVIGVACYAWFVSSRSVTAEGIRATIKGTSFELATAGDVSYFTDYTAEPTEETIEIDSQRMWWTFLNQTIQWRVTSSDNLGNFSGSNAGLNITADGLRPGLTGSMLFYVIPRESGPLRISFNLAIVPLELVREAQTEESPQINVGGDRMREITDSSKLDAKRLLRGHLLFAYPKYENGVPVEVDGTQVMELANYQDGSFVIDFGNINITTVDKPIAVQLKWMWPYMMGEVLDSEFPYRETVIGWMKTNPKYFFMNDNLPESTDDITTNPIWKESFDKADRRIGDVIDAIILRLDAQG